MLTSFLQGMGGFGVPVAIAAPILVTLGYTPLTSVVMAALGHSWSVNFGVMAAAFHPELVDDLRVHQMFLSFVEKVAR